MSQPQADPFRVDWPADMEQVPAGFFDGLYEQADDPWALAERWYEERKYELSVAALPLRRYRRALEVGCSIGLLTSRLAPRCIFLVAGDIAEAAVRATRERLVALRIDEQHVKVEVMAPPDRWPDGSFDLVVLSEVLYFSAGPRLELFIAGAIERLEPGGHLLAVHYRPDADPHLLNGDQVHARLIARPELTRVVEHVELGFRLDVFERTA